MSTKQVILMRSDLRNKEGHKVHTGKLMAQACHASMSFLTRKIYHDYGNGSGFQLTKEQEDWLDSGTRKIVLKVSSEEELMQYYNQSSGLGLETNLITDAGHTEFDKPTITCCAIGPHYEEEFDFLKHLSLY